MVSPLVSRPALVAGLCLVLLPACAPAPLRPDPHDPFERVNRTTYKVNDVLDRYIATPVAKTYRTVTPQFAQTGVTHFFSNLQEPETIVNDVLQGKPVTMLVQITRFLVNTTIGLGGLLDPASQMGLDSNPQDFGLTLGRWGAPPGPYLVLPILGPSDVRDGLGLVPEEYTDPVHYLPNAYVSWSLRLLRVTDERARLLDEQSILDRTFDRYAFLKNAYLQRRQYLITGTTGAEEPADAGMEEEMKEDDAADAAAKAAPPAVPPAKPAAPVAPPGRYPSEPASPQ
jgi:phospholipid-binding lipoprotein MlaA